MKGAYCKDALKLLGIKVVCGDKCPLFLTCPRLIIEDATDMAIEQAIKEMIKIVKKGRDK